MSRDSFSWIRFLRSPSSYYLNTFVSLKKQESVLWEALGRQILDPSSILFLNLSFERLKLSSQVKYLISFKRRRSLSSCLRGLWSGQFLAALCISTMWAVPPSSACYTRRTSLEHRDNLNKRWPHQASTGAGLSRMHPDLTLSLNQHPLKENQDKESQRRSYVLQLSHMPATALVLH